MAHVVPRRYSGPMKMPTLRKAAFWGGLTLSVSQAITIAALTVVDQQRKRRRKEPHFISPPVQNLPVADGSVCLFTRGCDLYNAMLASIESAEHTIYFETYIWKDDHDGHRFKRALIAAAERGVKVYLVYDVVGNMVVNPLFYRFPSSVKVLRHWPWSGVRPFRLSGPGLNHRKLLVIDHTEAYLGGYNIGSVYATQWRDTHVRIRGQAVLDLANAFVDYWNLARTRSLPALESPTNRPWTTPIRVTRNVPSAAVYPIRYSYLEAIDRASERLWMTHAYLVPDQDLLTALLDAVKRGVDVRIIVPAESNHIVADWISRSFYYQLLKGGVRLFLYQSAMVHAKTATADGIWSTIGTANLDRLSLMGNYEINAEIIDPDVARALEQIWEVDATHCHELTLDEWESRSLINKFSEAVLSPLGPLV